MVIALPTPCASKENQQTKNEEFDLKKRNTFLAKNKTTTVPQKKMQAFVIYYGNPPNKAFWISKEKYIVFFSFSRV